MEDQELLAAIGKVVVDSAALEYAIAVLVAITDGHRDQDCEGHAVAIVKKSGGAMRELRKMACAQLRGRGMSSRQTARMLTVSKERAVTERDVQDDLKRWDREHSGAGPLTQCYMIPVWRDVTAVLEDRHVIAHSLALEEIEAGGQAALVIYHPRSGRETEITAAQVLDHARDIRVAYRRVHELIAAVSDEA